MTADKVDVSSELSRDLNLFHITMMGMGMMIGAGVFLGIGLGIAEAGPGGVLLTFALNGVLALFSAMAYAELSSAIPRAGGAYNFARIGFGSGTSFIAGWMEWFASSVAGSLYGLTFAIYVFRYLRLMGLCDWLPAGADPHVERGVAVAIAVFFLYVNYRGASETGRVGAFFTLGQTLFLLAIAAAGIAVTVKDPARIANFQDFLPRGWWRLLATMGFTYVAFEGYEVIAQAGDEAVDPRRNLPKAMLLSVLVVTFTYVLTAFATVVAVKQTPAGFGGRPWEWIAQYREKGFGEAVGMLMPFANHLLTLAVIFSSTSALNATIYSATRASYALGRDRMLPPAFALISSRRRTPWFALLATAGLILTVIVFLPVEDVASSASIMFLFLFFLVNLCVIRIRRRMSDELTYGFLMPWFPLFPLLAIAANLALSVWLAHMSWKAWLIAPAWILSGVATYRCYSRSRAVATGAEISVLAEETEPAGDEYRIMVAVANPNNALSLIRSTYHLCAAKHAHVELLHMVPVPDQVPLSDAKRYMGDGQEGIAEAMLYLAPQFPISRTLRYCRNVARGIVSAVREKRVDMLILGWHGRPKRHIFTMGSTIDPVIEQCPCDIVMLKNVYDQTFQRVLVPIAGGPNSALALEIASILAERSGGKLTALTVHAGEPRFDIGAFVAANASRLRVEPENVAIRAVRSRHVVPAILDESDGHDAIVLGFTRQPLLRRLDRAAIPETVARITPKPVVMVQAAGPLGSWIRRWL